MTLFVRSTCLKVSSVALFMLLFQASRAQMDTASLSAFMEQKVRSLKDNNIVLAVGTKDTLVYKNDTKLFNVGRSQADIGYISEWFITALALQMVDDGKFSLDDKIAQYLPEFGRYGKGYITIRHCLTHNTGIQVPAKLELYTNMKSSALEAEANSYAAKEIQTNPGTEFRYSDRGFVIVAAIIEKMLKRKFEQVLNQKLFRPLGMRSTNYMSLDGSQQNPAFGARSSAGDLVAFGRMLLNNGQYNGTTILKPESVEQWRQVVAAADDMKNGPKETSTFDFALGGWALETKGAKASAMAAHSFAGTVVVVDFCRGYTFSYLQKTLDKKGESMMDIKAILDGGTQISCQ
jgi:CubicO group peptidase (beta-lactamase class C family)